MTAWMSVWIFLLALGVWGFVVLLFVVGAGAVRELKEVLGDLREDRRQAEAHPETLDEAI